MLNAPTHWQIWSTCEGALDQDFTVADSGDADQDSATLSLKYRDAGQAYEVFVLAHYCGENECSCIEWLQDHRPRYSWNPSTRA